MPLLISSTNVFDYLVNRGICPPQDESLSKIELKPAKNFNLLISLPQERQILVKQERHDRDGKTLATVHCLKIKKKSYREFLENSRQHQHITKGLERITPQIFGQLPADGLRFFALYQRYDNLGKAVAQLNQDFTPCCLTHNDLKLNNILLSLNWETEIEDKLPGNKNIIRLIDWERGSWGDPANDLGTIIASYLQIWLYSIVANKTIPIEECLRLAAIPLPMIQPSLSTLVSSYLNTFPEILEIRPDFLQLVMQFSGLALIRAIQARLQYEKTFDNSGICILQVAKSLLCRPLASISTILGMEFSTITSKNLSLV